MSRPLILITNDDGIDALGIRELIKIAKPFGDIIVVAPDRGRSAQSSALTVTEPLSYKELQGEKGVRMIAFSGTPADCVKFAFSLEIDRMDKIPDIVLSGINHGSNASINIIYSGTMGAAIEGALHLTTSVGFSLCDYKADADFSNALPFFSKIIDSVIKNPLPKGICLNVNAPKGEISGMKVCRQAKGIWHSEFEKNDEGFWIRGYFDNKEADGTDTDEYALSKGLISIQPANIDMTDYDLLKTLNI